MTFLSPGRTKKKRKKQEELKLKVKSRRRNQRNQLHEACNQRKKDSLQNRSQPKSEDQHIITSTNNTQDQPHLTHKNIRQDYYNGYSHHTIEQVAWLPFQKIKLQKVQSEFCVIFFHTKVWVYWHIGENST